MEHYASILGGLHNILDSISHFVRNYCNITGQSMIESFKDYGKNIANLWACICSTSIIRASKSIRDETPEGTFDKVFDLKLVT